MDFPDRMLTGISCPYGEQCWLLNFAKDESLSDARHDILLCKDCRYLKEIIGRSSGRRSADLALDKTISRLLQSVFDKTVSLEQKSKELKIRAEELFLIKIITDSAVKATGLDTALRIILTGVTSGRGFGFNRAGVFLVDERYGYLEGKHAVGPWDQQEASEIWNKLKHQTIDEQLEEIVYSPETRGGELDRSIRKIKIPLSDRNSIFIKGMHDQGPSIVRKEKIEQYLAQRIDAIVNFDEFVIVPLRSDGPPLGIMIADNYFTRRPILETDMDVLQTLAVTCTNILEKTILHSQLADRLSDLEQLNKALRENQNYLLRAERLTDLGRMASIIAHEFKTPLAAIGGYARKVLRNLDKGGCDPRDLEIIKSEVTRLETITAELLDFSRLKLEIRPLNLNSLTEQSLELIGNQIASSGIKLIRDLDRNIPSVGLDEQRFRQAFFNIVNNAIEAMNEGGRLKISTSADTDWVKLEIEDNGCGITEEDKRRLFDMFFTTKARGSGLGLSISKRIVEDHGGNIEVVSEEGKGTKFTLRFPVKPPMEDIKAR